MNIALQASLEKAIQKWADVECEGEDWPQQMWWPDGVVSRMAAAAFQVLAANKEAQDFAKEQDK